jgi:hypothetical protein
VNHYSIIAVVEEQVVVAFATVEELAVAEALAVVAAEAVGHFLVAESVVVEPWLLQPVGSAETTPLLLAPGSNRSG